MSTWITCENYSVSSSVHSGNTLTWSRLAWSHTSVHIHECKKLNKCEEGSSSLRQTFKVKGLSEPKPSCVSQLPIALWSVATVWGFALFFTLRAGTTTTQPLSCCPTRVLLRLENQGTEPHGIIVYSSSQCSNTMNFHCVFVEHSKKCFWGF